jgi:hypothetical protein
VKLSRLALFAAIMSAMFLVFEAGLRIAGGSEAAPVFQQLFMQDPAMGGYRLRPGAKARFRTTDFETDIEINSSGVRDREIPPKPPDERRIVVLGDSLVLAVQVEARETFCAVLEHRLNDRRVPGETSYRVINAGVQGYGPVEELAFFERVVRPLEPDVVLVAVYVANDAMEANDTGDSILPRDPAPASASQPSGVKRPSRWPLWLRRLTRRTMVLQIVRLRATTLLERFGEARPIDRALSIYLPDLPAETAHGLDVSREAIKRIAAGAAAQGARTGIVLLPARFQVADDNFDSLQAVVAQSGARLERNLATERFASALAPLGLPMFDALPVLRNDAARSQIFFKTTAHFTVIGHQVMAAGLESFVRSSGLVDGPKGR